MGATRRAPQFGPASRGIYGPEKPAFDGTWKRDNTRERAFGTPTLLPGH
jgi:hypothetical protein